MGIALWMACGLVGSLVARRIPSGRLRRWWHEAPLGVTVAMLLGLLATALDFGGWNELDWRAAAFTLAGSLAAIALARFMSMVRRASEVSAGSERGPR